MSWSLCLSISVSTSHPRSEVPSAEEWRKSQLLAPDTEMILRLLSHALERRPGPSRKEGVCWNCSHCGQSVWKSFL